MQVGVIYGGRSGEHEVSLMSARSVIAALDPTKYQVVEIGITHQGDWLVGDNLLANLECGATAALEPAIIFPQPGRKGLYHLVRENESEKLSYLAKIDVVFPVLHGSFGEDGTLQGLLELAGVAYVGAGVVGSALGMDKGVFKDVMRANGVPVLENVVILRSELNGDMQALISRLEKVAPYPLFVKPANLGSSVGVTKCTTRSDLIEGLMEAARYDRRILVERGVNPREIEVSVLGNDLPEASIPGEIIPSRDFYSYEAKYIDGKSELLIPAPISEELTERVRSLALQAYKAIDCAGMARVDFLLDKETGELYLNELNTIPGFTSISMYPKLWDACGLSYPALVDRLIELALERKAENDRTQREYEG